MHYLILQLVPLFFCLGLGVAAATLYTMRLAVKNPDVSWNKKKNPEPWNEYKNKQYKVKNCFSFMYNNYLLKLLIIHVSVSQSKWTRPLEMSSSGILRHILSLILYS